MSLRTLNVYGRETSEDATSLIGWREAFMIAGRGAYRGTFAPNWIVRRAGRGIEATRWSPPSSSLVTSSPPSLTSTFVTTLAWGSPRSPARRAPVAELMRSSDWTPVRTRSWGIVRIAAARRRATRPTSKAAGAS